MEPYLVGQSPFLNYVKRQDLQQSYLHKIFKKLVFFLALLSLYRYQNAFIDVPTANYGISNINHY